MITGIGGGGASYFCGASLPKPCGGSLKSEAEVRSKAFQALRRILDDSGATNGSTHYPTAIRDALTILEARGLRQDDMYAIARLLDAVVKRLTGALPDQPHYLSVQNARKQVEYIDQFGQPPVEIYVQPPENHA